MVDESAVDDGVYARYFPYLESTVQLVIEDGRVTAVTFPERPDERAGDEHVLLERIEAYLTGTAPDDFDDVALSLGVPDDGTTILEAVRTIPYGEALSVAELLSQVPGFDSDDDADYDRVREVLEANPTPLLLPDHRVRDAPSGAPPRIEQRLRSLERIVK